MTAATQLGTLPASRKQGLRRDAIVQLLMADIFHGRITAGAHLVTQELAARFGVSHTPVREALIALSGVGLILLQPNRGAVVRKISRREVREVCLVRRALECEAVRGACGRVDPKALQPLAHGLARLEALGSKMGPNAVQRAQELDTQLHDLIAQSAGNMFLTHELNRLKLLFRAFRDVAWEHDSAENDYRRITEEAREHAAIVSALLSNNRRAAVAAMSRHIRSGITCWSRALVSQPRAQEESGADSAP